MPAISTRNARVEVFIWDAGVTVVLLATRWSVEARSDEIDVTNFETGGFAEFLPGYVEANISVDGFYEKEGTPFAYNIGTPMINAGNYVGLTLYASRDAGGVDYFDFPKAFILSATGEAAVRDAARVSFTARNFGPFEYPGAVTFSGIEVLP